MLVTPRALNKCSRCDFVVLINSNKSYISKKVRNLKKEKVKNFNIKSTNKWRTRGRGGWQMPPLTLQNSKYININND